MEYFMLTIDEIEELERRAEEEILTMEEVEKLLKEIEIVKDRLNTLKAKIKGVYEITERGFELITEKEDIVSRIERAVRKAIREEIRKLKE